LISGAPDAAADAVRFAPRPPPLLEVPAVLACVVVAIAVAFAVAVAVDADIVLVPVLVLVPALVLAPAIVPVPVLAVVVSIAVVVAVSAVALGSAAPVSGAEPGVEAGGVTVAVVLRLASRHPRKPSPRTTARAAANAIGTTADRPGGEGAGSTGSGAETDARPAAAGALGPARSMRTVCVWTIGPGARAAPRAAPRAGMDISRAVVLTSSTVPTPAA
jgi:hypothetical protein